MFWSKIYQFKKYSGKVLQAISYLGAALFSVIASLILS